MRSPYLSALLCALIPIVRAATTVSILYKFPSGTWIENIAVRSNGNLLVVLWSTPEVYEIDPFVSPPVVQRVANFQGYSGIQGIVEVTEDLFAVIPFDSSSYSLWTVDMTSTSNDSSEEEASLTRIIPAVPDVGILNGLTKLSDTLLLASDTRYGSVVSFDLTTNTSAIAIKDDTMSGLPLSLGAGINGLRARNNTIYYTNSIKGIFCRLAMDPEPPTTAGPAEVIAEGLGFIDDLAIGRTDDDPSYLMQYLAGSIVEVQGDGSAHVIVEGLDFPTSAAFGRSDVDKNRLYVSSTGSPPGLYLKGLLAGGKVYAVDLD